MKPGRRWAGCVFCGFYMALCALGYLAASAVLWAIERW